MSLRWFFLVACLALVLVACQTWRAGEKAAVEPKAAVASEAPEGHPELSPQEKLKPCAACHRDVTPDVYQEWYNSRHGLDNVKCFQCHGTYENFEAEPSVGRCAACHAQEVAHAPKDKKCWACHPAHKFSVHK